jgi:hypothetical protein
MQLVNSVNCLFMSFQKIMLVNCAAIRCVEKEMRRKNRRGFKGEAIAFQFISRLKCSAGMNN